MSISQTSNTLIVFSEHVKEVSIEFCFIDVFTGIKRIIKRISNLCYFLTIANCLLLCFVILDFEFSFIDILS